MFSSPRGQSTVYSVTQVDSAGIYRPSYTGRGQPGNMAMASVETMQEQSDMIGMARNTTLSQKRGREDEIGAGLTDKKWPGWPGDNVFRLLVPVQKVGGIIGRKGEFVKKMCEETRSRIKILEGIQGTPERTVMVSAKEEPEASISPAMDGILKVHKRIIEGGPDGIGELGRAQQGGSGMISTRLLVAGTQAGSLIGRQGATIKAIQEGSGAIVRVLGPEDLPFCALADDRLVEVQGEAGSVHKAVELIVSHLRKFLVDRSVLPLFEANRTIGNQPQIEENPPHQSWGHNQSSSVPSSGGAGLGNTQYMASAFQHDNYYQPSDLPLESQGHHGLSVYGRDPSLAGHSVANQPPAPVITQVTQHMQIPLSYADAIIGTAGSNISYMRRNSGATIAIQETRGVPGEMTVEIHGTATQVQTAQQLIQNFMAGASGPPANTYSSVDSGYNSYPTQNSMYSSPQPNTGHASHSTGGYVSHYNSNYGY